MEGQALEVLNILLKKIKKMEDETIQPVEGTPEETTTEEKTEEPTAE